jgi:Protein of unknown function (DUF3829)
MRNATFIAITAIVIGLGPAVAEQTPPASSASGSSAHLTEKLNAYVGCINRLSGRSFESRERYFSWASKSGPTGKEPIVYGTYTIYDTSDCKKNVAAANAMEPHDADLEAAASAYVAAVTALEPLLKEADDYYTQENYKDDKMAKGKAMHPRLIAAWDAFAGADKSLRGAVDAINDKRAIERLAAIDQSEGRKVHYYVEALMIQAKRVVRAQEAEKPDLNTITQAVGDYEAVVKSTEDASGKDGDVKLGSMFVGNAKSFLTTAKQLMRRLRDKVPYSAGEKMMIGNAGAGWMVEGSPARLMRDYNALVDSYNSGSRI